MARLRAILSLPWLQSVEPILTCCRSDETTIPLTVMIPLRCTTGLTLRRHPHSPPPTNSKPAKGQVGATDSAYFNRKLVACAAALMLWLSTATGLLAQEPATELSDVQRIIRSTLQDRDPQEPVPVAQAAEMLVNVQLYEDAKAMLVRLQALQLNDEQLLELTAKVGSNFFQEIYLNRDLQPIGQTVGDYVLRGAHRGLQSPKRYDSLLRSLNSDDLSARNTALRQLRTIGEPAIANILNAFTQDARVEQFPGLRSALKSLATELPRPIIAAGTANDPQVKLEAIRAMAKINSKEALSVLYLAMLAPNQNDLIRSTASEILATRPGAHVDTFQIEKWFHQETMEALKLKRDPVLLRQSSNVWIWDNKLQKIVSQPSNVATDRCRRASYFAQGLYESYPLSTGNRELYLLTQLELAKRVAGPNAAINTAKLTNKLHLTAAETNQLLHAAVKCELFPAATACCEILKSIGDTSVLTQLSGNYPPLTHAILSGERSVQFAALDAIAQLDPKQAFPGSSHAVTLAVFLAGGSGQPAALVGNHRLDVAQTYAATVASSGLRGEAAQTGRELFQIATTNSDIEIILISDNITSPGFDSLIQQLRNDWRTSRVPIALLYDDARRSQRAMLRLGRNNVTAIPFTSTPSLIGSSVDQMVKQVSTFRQDHLQRSRQANVAIRWIAKIAKDRQSYPFFNLGRHQEKIQQLIYQPGFLTPVSEILSNIATPDAQRQLLNFANENGLPIEQREQAVTAFQAAVKRAGILLTTDEILMQYNRYNASQAQPKETQQLLGSVLDIIEAGK